MSETFADRLKILREKKGWNKAEVARKLGVSGGAYSNWEYGNRKPNFEFTQKIAQLFDVSTNYLLEGTYMLRDIHIMPESEQEKIVETLKDTGKMMKNALGKELARKIENLDTSNLTVNERYFLDQAINFMINYSDVNKENILLIFGAFFRSLNTYYEDLYEDLTDESMTKEERLEIYKEDLSETFNALSKELDAILNKEDN